MPHHPDQIAEIAAKLSDAGRRAMQSIHGDFTVGQRFRLDEGDHHAPYTALAKRGLLNKERIGGWHTTYALTPLGLALRQYLKEQGQ